MLLNSFPYIIMCQSFVSITRKKFKIRTKYRLALDLKLASKRNVPLEKECEMGVFRVKFCWYDNCYHFVLVFGASLANPHY